MMAQMMRMRTVMGMMDKAMLILVFVLFRPLPATASAPLVLSTRAFGLPVRRSGVVFLPDPFRLPPIPFHHINTTIVVYMMVWKCSLVWIVVKLPVSGLFPTRLAKKLVFMSKYSQEAAGGGGAGKLVGTRGMLP